MPLYEPVAYYHHHKNYLKRKTEYLDDDDEDSDVEIYPDDKRGFISSNSHFYENALSSRQRCVRLPESSSGGKLTIIQSLQYASYYNISPIQGITFLFNIDVVDLVRQLFLAEILAILIVFSIKIQYPEST